jgi:hypothetical protein
MLPGIFRVDHIWQLQSRPHVDGLGKVDRLIKEPFDADLVRLLLVSVPDTRLTLGASGHRLSRHSIDCTTSRFSLS